MAFLHPLSDHSESHSESFGPLAGLPLRGGAAEPGKVATPGFLCSTPPSPPMVHVATRMSGRRRPLPYLHDRYMHNYSKHDGMRSQRGQMATSAPQARPGRRGWPRRDRRPPPGRPQLARRRLRAAHAACGTLSRRAHTQADELGESAARGRNLLRESDEEGRVRGGWPGRGAGPLGSGCGSDAQR